MSVNWNWAIGKAHAAYNSAERTYDQAINTRQYFDELLFSIPLEEEGLHKQVQAWQDKAVEAINAAYHAKRAAEEALGAVQKQLKIQQSD